jgi:hypothetical protein
MLGSSSTNTDLDSHFRYLSGLLLGIGFAFIYCALAIERRAMLFRALGLIVILGGLARLFGAVVHGLPSGGHRFGLMMELIVVPAVLMWHARVGQRMEH